MVSQYLYNNSLSVCHFVSLSVCPPPLQRAKRAHVCDVGPDCEYSIKTHTYIFTKFKFYFHTRFKFTYYSYFARKSNTESEGVSSIYKGAFSNSETLENNLCHSSSDICPFLNFSEEIPVSEAIILVIN